MAGFAFSGINFAVMGCLPPASISKSCPKTVNPSFGHFQAMLARIDGDRDRSLFAFLADLDLPLFVQHFDVSIRFIDCDDQRAVFGSQRHHHAGRARSTRRGRQYRSASDFLRCLPPSAGAGLVRTTGSRTFIETWRLKIRLNAMIDRANTFPKIDRLFFSFAALFQISDHFGHGLVAVFDFLGDHLLEDGFNLFRDFGAYARNDGIGISRWARNFSISVSPDRWPCRSAGKTASSPGYKCRPGRRRLRVQGLLRGHVIDRAHDGPGAGQFGLRRGIANRVDPGQPHVENLDVPSLSSSRLAGLMSRWTIPFLWAELQTPGGLQDVVDGLVDRERPILLDQAERSLPSTNSMTRKWTPLASSASSAATMFGWLSLAAALTSRSKRATAACILGHRRQAAS